jgi:hypothetical protein
MSFNVSYKMFVYTHPWATRVHFFVNAFTWFTTIRWSEKRIIDIDRKTTVETQR